MRRLTAILASLLVVFTCALAVQPAFATDVFSGACGTSGASKSPACSGHTSTNPLVGPNGTLQKVTRIVATIAGAVAVIMMIAGGVMYIFSNGDSSKISSAKNTVIYAAVGLVIIASGQAIIVFVLNKL